MPRITKSDKNTRITITAKTVEKKPETPRALRWWKAGSQAELASQVLTTVAFLKTQQTYRYRQAGIFAKLYGNHPLYDFAGTSVGKVLDSSNMRLPVDRPTMNVIQSCIDTLVSRVTQSRPRPLFLTDNGDYKERKLAKQMNNFIQGELFQTKAYELGEFLLRDAGIFGTGVLKVFETDDHKIGLERRLLTEILVDPNDAYYGFPTQLFEVKLVDRAVLQELYPDSKPEIRSAEQAFPELNDAERSISDQIIIAEGWHLRSSHEATDGRHVIVCSAGTILNEEYTKDYFPFIFQHFSPRPLGFWGQGLAEQLTGTQTQINELLITISKAINLVGVPRVFVEDGSKVSKASFNNNVGTIINYKGMKPIYEVAPCMPQEVYAQLERLVQYAYQQSGISSLAAVGQKPAGLDSGEAIRTYDQLQTDRFAALERRYEKAFIDLAYQICDKARDIAERDGHYQTVYPNKDGTKQIDLPDVKKLEDPFVIQCFDTSSLPKDPAGRDSKITEYMQAGILSPDEGRRLLDFPDLEQVDKLATAGEERILQVLDAIVEDGKYTPPDPFMDLQMAMKLTVQYYNLYVPAKLEPKREDMLRNFFTQIQQMIAASQPPPMPMANAVSPQANPTAPPVSQLIPNGPQQ